MAQEPAVNQDKDDSDMESFIEDYFRSEQAKKTVSAVKHHYRCSQQVHIHNLSYYHSSDI